MKNSSIAVVIYGEPGSPRNALTEEKYKKLVVNFIENGFLVDSVLYHDSVCDTLERELEDYDAILVWVNPIEQGNSRKLLDALLLKLSQNRFVSAHPDAILKIGTKEILYTVRDTEFGSDTKLYETFEDFKQRFFDQAFDTRILKQFRGNGGNGVFRIDLSAGKHNKVGVTHAASGEVNRQLSIDEFYSAFEKYFISGGSLVDQAWNPNIVNGMVRCYISGNKVSGFGYQEVNALYPVIDSVSKKPSQRFYYSEDCGLFSDLRNIMENKWIPQLQQITGIRSDMLPVIWDADFFINKINTDSPNEKYSLCEINASCVSPFPESAIPHIVKEVTARIIK